MRTSIKDVGFAVFFLLVIAVVAVQAADDQSNRGSQEIESAPVATPEAHRP